MEVLECIETRRSVRKYTDRAVEKALVEKLVRAAQNAPTWKNSQTTRFTAVLDSEKRWQVRAALPDFNQNSTQNAPVYLIVSAVTHRSGYERDGSATTPLGEGYTFFDCGARRRARHPHHGHLRRRQAPQRAENPRDRGPSRRSRPRLSGRRPADAEAPGA